MRVFVLGVRGIPNVQGGVETHAEQLYERLASLGCQVEVLVRAPFVPAGQRTFGAIRLRRLWSPTRPGAEAFVHSLLGVLYAGFRRPDILHIHAVGPAIVTPIARLLGLKVVVTNHGPDYEREKWGACARWVLRMGERVGMRCSNARIAISQAIAERVKARYGVDSEQVPNGVMLQESPRGTEHLSRFGLEAGRYFLQVSRIVPEKRQLDLIAAYARAQPLPWKLVLTGKLDRTEYARRVEAAARNAGVVLTDFLNGEPLRQLYAHAGSFVLPSSHEGLPIVVLEALSYGVPVLASAIPANLEIGLDTNCYFPLGDLEALAAALRHRSAELIDSARRRELQRWVTEKYDWDKIAARTLELYASVCRSGSVPSPSELPDRR